MFAHCAAFVALSLDGFLAREDGSLDWLAQASAALPPGADGGYGEFMAEVDAVVMGRRTFQMLMAWDEWPYGDLTVYVLSRTLTQLPPGAPDTTLLREGSPAMVAAQAHRAGQRRLAIEGGATIRAFWQAGLLKDLSIIMVPVILGTGLRLTDASLRDTWLRPIATQRLPAGMLQTRYAIGPDGQAEP